MSELKGDFGFIGLGMMGYAMALNVRRKIPSSSKLYIYDISKSALEKFAQEIGSSGNVIIASSSKDVVDHAVLDSLSLADSRTLLSLCCRKVHTSSLHSLPRKPAALLPLPSPRNCSSTAAQLTQQLPLKSVRLSTSPVSESSLTLLSPYGFYLFH
jgi:hypothetical protein